ncbi:MAG: hypothetical protein N3A69_05550 [Leptospiraceae bacterium]|nr:hypothetical protein [Leptospiraceae bacterium]
MKRFILVSLVFFVSCGKWKKEVNSQDIQKVLDRFAYVRLFQRFELEDLYSIKSDKELFIEICELNRIPPELLLAKLKETHPTLYQHLGKYHEK